MFFQASQTSAEKQSIDNQSQSILNDLSDLPTQDFHVETLIKAKCLTNLLNFCHTSGPDECFNVKHMSCLTR